jgi:hypothetical protein
MKIKNITMAMIIMIGATSSALAFNLPQGDRRVAMKAEQQKLDYHDDMYKLYQCKNFRGSIYNKYCLQFKIDNPNFANPGDYNDFYK